jgi:hypothetical protein
MVEPLAGENIEMVVPEIDHRLLELAPAVERAKHPRGLCLLDDDAGALAPRLALLGAGLRPLRAVVEEQLHRVERQRVERGEKLAERGRLGDRLGVKLGGDIGLGADRLDMGEIARGRAEAEPVEQVDGEAPRRRLGGGEAQGGQRNGGAGGGEEAAAQHGDGSTRAAAALSPPVRRYLRKFGLRFSMKARVPSFASSVP